MKYSLDQLREMILPMIKSLDNRPEQVADAVVEIIKQDREVQAAITGDTSDGFHTFNELYRFRMLYNAAWFNLIEDEGIWPVYKSKLHSDGTEPFGGGWFAVGADLPTGQISNHYEMPHWDLFVVPELARMPVWDGHTAEVVAQRLEEFLGRYRHD